MSGLADLHATAQRVHAESWTWVEAAQNLWRLEGPRECVSIMHRAGTAEGNQNCEVASFIEAVSPRVVVVLCEAIQAALDVDELQTRLGEDTEDFSGVEAQFLEAEARLDAALVRVREELA